MSTEWKGIGIEGFAGYELTDQLLYNLKWWLDWGFVNHGAYEVYYYDSESFYDDDESKLHPVLDERYEEGRVWEGAGREWVWESGISVPSGGIEPFRVSGVYIDGIFYSNNAIGTYGHHIDYQNGRIIFDRPQNYTSRPRRQNPFRRGI